MAYVVPAGLELPAVARLSSRVVRVLGHNPSPMTLAGTNTYLVGTGHRRALVDTGEGKADYAASLRSAVAAESQLLGGPVSVSTVLLTHWHQDHVGGVKDVLAAFPDATVRKNPTAVADDALFLPAPAAPMSDGERIEVDADTTLRAVCTPGHTDDHVSLVLEQEHALFSGDCILGAGSSVFSSYCDFMHSLEALRRLRPKVVYPGHGPVVEDGAAKIEEYIAHREARERQITAAIPAGPPGTTAWDIVAAVYTDTPKELHPAAAMNVCHHLRKLAQEQRITCATAEADMTPPQRAAVAASDYAVSAEGSQVSAALRAEGKAATDAAYEAAADVLRAYATLRWTR